MRNVAPRAEVWRGHSRRPTHTVRQAASEGSSSETGESSRHKGLVKWNRKQLTTAQVSQEAKSNRCQPPVIRVTFQQLVQRDLSLVLNEAVY